MEKVLGQETARIIYRKEKTEEQTNSEEKTTKQEAEKKCDWSEPSPPPVYEI